MRKVLFITSTFPRSENEALAKWIGELAVKLKKTGTNVSVFAPSSNGLNSHTYHGVIVNRFRYAPKALEILTQDEGAVFKIKRNPLIIFLVPLFFFFGFIKLAKLLRKEHFDIIHVHWPFPMGLFGILAKSINKGKLILTFYGVEFVLTGKVPFGNLILKLIIKFADKVTAISTYAKSLVRKEYNVPVSVIPYTSSFSIDSIIDKSKRGDKEKKVKTVLFVGRLIERKGVKYLISAMPKVLDKINARLEIVGSGPLSEELKRLIVKLRLEKNVNLRGRVDDQALADLYRKCDVFVLPSIKDKWGDTEGLGVVLLEAMGFKKPVIASEIGGITDIVKHGQTGLLVKQKNVEGLADAIVKILQDNKLSLTLAENGLSYLKNNFSWKETIRKTKELYE